MLQSLIKRCGIMWNNVRIRCDRCKGGSATSSDESDREIERQLAIHQYRREQGRSDQDFRDEVARAFAAIRSVFAARDQLKNTVLMRQWNSLQVLRTDAQLFRNPWQTIFLSSSCILGRRAVSKICLPDLSSRPPGRPKKLSSRFVLQQKFVFQECS